MLFLVFLLFSSLDLQIISGATTDTLTLGQSLPWNQTLVSKGGNFELGLFSPGKSKKHYIGIWFKKVSKQTAVWVANRDRPILDPSASRFTLSDRGELVLRATPSNTLLWSSNASSPSPNTTVATLQDDGNLVVRTNATASAWSPVAWQSFDHPTDTWLPGARLGYDRARGVHSFLTSWTDSENPAPGAFSMEIDPRGQAKFDLLAGGTRQYWTSGVWDGEVFANVPEIRWSGYFDGVPYAPNASVNFFSYKNRAPGISNFVLEVNGQMQRRQWSPEAGNWILFCAEPHDGCDVYGSCGAFGVCNNTSSTMCECPTAFAPRSQAEWKLGNTASGCVRRTKLDCPNDGFLKLPDTVQRPAGSAEAAGTRSEKMCALSCLRDCSCTAYAYDAAKCLVWNGELVSLRTLPGDQGISGAVVLHVRVAASEVPPPAPHHSWRKSMVILSSSVSAVVLLLAGLIIVVAVAVAVVLRKRRGKGKVTAVQGSLLLFDYQAVKAATRDFTEKLGSGSFGSVYKGTLPDTTPVAVKKLDGLRQGDKQFRAEVVTLGMIHHVNLVRLCGFCSEGNKRALVYDYMPNGSLDAHLFNNSSSSKVLSWSQRFGIAVGVARGLSYLHEKCRECIIHCDIKPENILLDEEMGAKLVGHDFSRVLTTMRGTMGYLAPEWLAGEPVTAKADVYSFGLLLFELVSGHRNNGSAEKGGTSAVYFPVHAAVMLHAGDVVSLLDEKIAGDAKVLLISSCGRSRHGFTCWQ